MKKVIRDNMLLKETEVLILDCQATGPNPQIGHLIEIGWMRCRPNQKGSFTSTACETHLIQLPENYDMPRRVKQITGISSEDLRDAVSLKEVWNRLFRTVKQVARANGTHQCPTIIHFARYETPFLKCLHRQFAPDDRFPFAMVCTHEIVKRLVPGLPRKGLRAISGYFGFSVSEKRRCVHHLKATLSIWNREVKLLEQDHDIQILDELMAWLEKNKQSRKHCRVYPMDRNVRLKLPDSPGVYRFLRSNEDLLYIGKAKSLKNRVNSYFQKNRKQPEHVLEMLSQACDIDYTVTDSAVEAAVLESDQIKTVSPPYNIALTHGDREIGFSSGDFRDQARNPDSTLTVGPMPSPDALIPLSILGRHLQGGDIQAEDGPALLNIPLEYAPEFHLIEAGLREFFKRHETELKSAPPFKGFIRLGAGFWKARMAEADEALLETENPVEEVADEIENNEWEWTPETVANAIESIIRRCVHLIRRGRWFCLISESSLVWESGYKANSDRNLLEFHKGKLVRKGFLKDRALPPVPRGYQSSTILRQQSFDVMTYDRMRVVTTEIRRLISEGRDVELRLRPNTTLKNRSLKRFLQWI